MRRLTAPPAPVPDSPCNLAPAAATRRALLQRSVWGAAWVAAPALVQTAWAQAPLAPTPRQTEGPLYPIALPADSDADLLRNGPLQYTQGQAVWVQGRVTDTAGVPLAGGVVEIWQCDAAGHYHHPGDGGQAAGLFPVVTIGDAIEQAGTVGIAATGRIEDLFGPDTGDVVATAIGINIRAFATARHDHIKST